MPLSPTDIATARTLQLSAAHDALPAVRLVAGPGTGKSSSIEERFRWLLEDQGVAADAVFGVSFTRAAANDLKLRVTKYLDDNAQVVEPDNLRISTLHSLALRLLARANLLTTYPVRPRVLDEWEVEHVFDAEFRVTTGIGKERAEDIRRAHEAFWNTGQTLPPGYIEPRPAITDEERRAFLAFHATTTQTYAAVLPGEIVRRCVEQIEAGNLVLRDVADMAYLIVDEYQDLNPLDIRLVDQIAEDGVTIFVAGDDDQSIYSFRFAAPGGIQDFPIRHAGSGDHILQGCFRCASEIVQAADTLIEHFSPPSRIGKTLESLWSTATPPSGGVVMRWRAGNGTLEARLIAESARALVEAGLPARNIMVLLSNRRGLLPPIRTALTNAGVSFTLPREETWRDTEGGRFMLGVLRLAADDEDYLALRLILGCRRQVGVATCRAIARKVADHLLNYRSIFVDPLPQGVFEGRELTALQHARSVREMVAGFTAGDLLGDREAELRHALVDARGAEEAGPWDELVRVLPSDAKLSEVRDYLYAENPEQQETVQKAIFERLELPVPEDLPEPRVRVMTMHGAKGLQADVVFIPGLEEPILPGPKRAAVPGLVLEAARLLYVSMTRARAALIMSRATYRFWQGQARNPAPSRYATHVGGPFRPRSNPMSVAEASTIVDIVRDMNRT
jgi:DNA helicase-2/ATP-dependent DNA helicase PcrA